VGERLSQPREVGRRRIELGETIVDYTLRRSGRRTLGITVEPDGELVVTAPNDAGEEQIEATLRRRRSWILRHRRETAALPPPIPTHEWVSGETHRYLGRQYRLKVKVEQGEGAGVRLIGRFFHVSVPDPEDTDQVRRRMERWYLDRARKTFERRMADLIRQTPRLRLKEPPPLIVRKMKRRWGSCSAEGRIVMNVEAVKLPVGCIDYLLMHELCHLHVPHHGPEFWRLLDACMPDWEVWRRRLDRVEV